MTTPTEDGLAAWRAFLYAHVTVISQIERDLAVAGCVPLTWYDVLIELWEAPAHRLRLHELADRVVLSRSGVTRLVDRLETAGLLARERVAGDRRGAYAVLTAAGAAALNQAWPVYGRGIATHFTDQLSHDEIQVITAALDRVRAARSRPPPPE